jgi:HAD superfamily hydrolase (TIGR01509 family)
MLFHHFLFDFDGTLADSSSLHERAFRQTLATVAPCALARFDYAALKGLTTRATFVRLGLADDVLFERCVVRKQELYRAAVRRGRLKVLPGARAVLSAAAQQGRRNYLVSSGSAASIKLALEALGLAGFFSGVITCDDTPEGKPAPDPYQACLERFGLRRSEAIAIEDAPSGVASARAAGLRVIGVNNSSIAKLVDFYFDDLVGLNVAIRECGRQRRAA